MTTTTDQDVLAFAKKSQASLEDDISAAREAAKVARANQRDYEGDLRTQLMGKLIKVTTRLETSERMIQDGFEHSTSYSELKDATLRVSGVFITKKDPWDHVGTPLIYARRVEENGETLLGSEVTFRLLKAKKLVILPS